MDGFNTGVSSARILAELKTENIDEYFDMFDSKYFEGKQYTTQEKAMIKSICSGVYNALGQGNNYDFNLSDLEMQNERIRISRYFNVIPHFTCKTCEMIHLAKCYNCDTNYIWNEQDKGLVCNKCKKSYSDVFYLKCDEEPASSEYKVTECMTLLPTETLIELVTKFIASTGKNFNNEISSFYITNSVLYFFNEAPKVEVKLTEISHFKDIDLNLRLQQNELYTTLHSEALALKEKCNSSTVENCNACLETPKRSCLMKMFKYIESDYHLEPHKPGEYGDVSFSTNLNGADATLKIIMKSTKKGNITSSSADGREVLGQVITQYMTDNYQTILGILATPGVERSLRQHIIELSRLKKGKVFFIEEQQLAGILQLAKQNGFQP